jgi:hypothetical protein
MTRLKATLAIVAATTILTQYAALNALAADYGPPSSVAALKQDVPRLLAASLGADRAALVDMIYTDGTHAVVTWHAGNARGLIVLRFNRATWWWVAGAATVNSRSGYWTPLSSPGEDVTDCGASRSGSPTVNEILASGFISESFARGLDQYYKPLQVAVAKDRPVTSCDYPPPYSDTNDGYDASLITKGASEWASIRGGAPPKDQMPPVYYTFTLSNHSSLQANIEAASTLRIWFPFVIDNNERYTLRLRVANEDIYQIIGIESANTLSFTLPQISLVAGRDVRGEIEGQR